jgi:hypothetical protein
MLGSLLRIHPFVRHTRDLWIARTGTVDNAGNACTRHGLGNVRPAALARSVWRASALMIGIPLHSWPCAEKGGPMEPNRDPFAALCGKRRPDGAEPRPIRGPVRKDAHARTRDGRGGYEVQARHRRAYSPSAATNS